MGAPHAAVQVLGSLNPEPWVMVCGLWFVVMVYGSWCIGDGSWFMVHGFWLMVMAYDLWIMVYSLWFMVCGLGIMVYG